MKCPRLVVIPFEESGANIGPGDVLATGKVPTKEILEEPSHSMNLLGWISNAKNLLEKVLVSSIVVIFSSR